MKNIPPFIFTIGILISTFNVCYPQTGGWAWMGGTKNLNDTGSYGIKGVPSKTNLPQCRYEAGQWTDKNGNFWLSGGWQGSGSITNDMWRFNPDSMVWTWMGGNLAPYDQGEFGTQGVPGPNNLPPARHCPTCWVDTSGMFWMFGGEVFNDLWRYNPYTNEWTWMLGMGPTLNNVGNYGVKGISSPTNVPPGRDEATASWVGSDNTLWFYGGLVNPNLDNCYGDMWKYDISINKWTWMSGSDSTIPPPARYGTKGIADSNNYPGGRMVYAGWKDYTNGYFWMLGGLLGEGDAGLNDLWLYNPTANTWSWMGGDTIYNVFDPGTECTLGASTRVLPVGENKSSWIDDCGNFWTFGGGIYGRFDSGYNAFWKYDVMQGEFGWVSGSMETGDHGIYGPLGQSSSSYCPPARSGACAWKANDGSFWLYGGSANSTNSYGDLWIYTLDSSCLGSRCSEQCNLAPPFISTNQNKICSGDSTQICAPAGFSSYQWNANTTGTGNCIYAKQAGDYYVTVTDANGCIAESNHLPISVYPVPSVAIIREGDTLSSYGQVGYQWYYNNNPIPNATNRVYIAKEQGSYAVQITDTNDCTEISQPVSITGVNDLAEEESVLLYPNPNSIGLWQLQVSNELIGSRLEVYDDEGRIVFHSEIKKQKSEITITGLPSGVYYLRISNYKSSAVRKLVKL